jgi:phosphatidylinositol 4-kinase
LIEINKEKENNSNILKDFIPNSSYFNKDKDKEKDKDKDKDKNRKSKFDILRNLFSSNNNKDNNKDKDKDKDILNFELSSDFSEAERIPKTSRTKSNKKDDKKSFLISENRNIINNNNPLKELENDFGNILQKKPLQVNNKNNDNYYTNSFSHSNSNSNSNSLSLSDGNKLDLNNYIMESDINLSKPISIKNIYESNFNINNPNNLNNSNCNTNNNSSENNNNINNEDKAINKIKSGKNKIKEFIKEKFLTDKKKSNKKDVAKNLYENLNNTFNENDLNNEKIKIPIPIFNQRKNSRSSNEPDNEVDYETDPEDMRKIDEVIKREVNLNLHSPKEQANKIELNNSINLNLDKIIKSKKSANLKSKNKYDNLIEEKSYSDFNNDKDNNNNNNNNSNTDEDQEKSLDENENENENQKGSNLDLRKNKNFFSESESDNNDNDNENDINNNYNDNYNENSNYVNDNKSKNKEKNLKNKRKKYSENNFEEFNNDINNTNNNNKNKIEEKEKEKNISLDLENYEIKSTFFPKFEDIFGEKIEIQRERLRKKSPFGIFQTFNLFKVIVKNGEDLRQEQFATQLINEFQQIFKLEKVECWVNIYEILATGNNAGLIEVVPNSISLDQLKRKAKGINSLRHFFEVYYGPVESKKFKSAMKNFISSLAGYSLVCYFLQIKDRHNGNILIDDSGHLIHIDFGFMFTNSPGKGLKFEKAPFKLTKDFVDVMGGVNSKYFQKFRKLLWKYLINFFSI